MKCNWCQDHDKYREKANARNKITGVKDKEVIRFISLAANAQRNAGHELGDCEIKPLMRESHEGEGVEWTDENGNPL